MEFFHINLNKEEEMKVDSVYLCYKINCKFKIGKNVNISEINSFKRLPIIDKMS